MLASASAFSIGRAWSKASGFQFNRKGFLAREGFVYDTEPICRAVVTARAFAPGQNLLPLFRTLQRAFYIDEIPQKRKL